MLRVLNQALCFHNRLNHNSEISEVMGIKVKVSNFRCARCGKVVWGTGRTRLWSETLQMTVIGNIHENPELLEV